MAKSIILFLMLVIVPSIGEPGQQITEPQQREIKEDLQNKALAMLASLREKDADAALANYGRQDEFVHIDNGNSVPWDTLERLVRDYLQTTISNEIYWVGTPNVLVVNSGAAVVYGRHKISGTGTSVDSHEGEWSGVFQKIDGSWHLVHSHSSDVKSPN